MHLILTMFGFLKPVIEKYIKARFKFEFQSSCDTK